METNISLISLLVLSGIIYQNDDRKAIFIVGFLSALFYFVGDLISAENQYIYYSMAMMFDALIIKTLYELEPSMLIHKITPLFVTFIYLNLLGFAAYMYYIDVKYYNSLCELLYVVLLYRILTGGWYDRDNSVRRGSNSFSGGNFTQHFNLQGGQKKL